MLIIGGKRYCGKTTELIKISSENQIPIVVINPMRGQAVKQLAKRMNLKIPEPICYDNKQKFIGNRKNLLVDDVEDILQAIFLGNRIVEIATSMPFKAMDEINRYEPMEQRDKILENEKRTCLHCGGNNARYCEECYQKLLTINIALQCALPKDIAIGLDLGSGVSRQIESHIPHID